MSSSEGSAAGDQEERVFRFEDPDPGPVSAFTRFPEDVWRLIIRYINDPADYQNMMSSSAELYGLKEERCTTHLFPAILKYISVYLTERQCNSLRLVCKKWKHAMDTHYENPFELKFQPSHLSNESAPVAKFGPRHVGAVLSTFRRIQEVSRVCEQQPSDYSPFLGRQLSIKCGEADEEGFWEQVSLLLILVGHSVRFLRIQYFKIAAFVNCLNKMPNLESMHVIGHPDVFVYDDEDRNNYLGRYPITHFQFLRYLTIENDVPFTVSQYLSNEHALQLVNLHLNAYCHQDFSSGFPNLNCLKCGLDLYDLSVLATCLPAIRELDLTVNTYDRGPDTSMSYERVLQLVQRFHGTLRKLSILIHADFTLGPLTFRINLPHLAELTVRNFRSNMTLDPFLLCRNLQRVSLTGRVNLLSWQKYSVIRYDSVDGSLSTDIWSYLPNLQVLLLPTPFVNFYKPT